MNILNLLQKMLAWTKSRADLQFVMYSRPGCHLCDDAWRELTEAQLRYRFPLERRDVDADPESAAQFGDSIPVVTVNGKVRFRGLVNRAMLQRLLEHDTG
jgi:glutaredoxin